MNPIEFLARVNEVNGSKPKKIFGCEACIYATHMSIHTCKEHEGKIELRRKLITCPK